MTVSATGGNPFNIVVNSLTGFNADGAPANWDSSLADSWLIATANSGTFKGSVLRNLFVDSTQFSTYNSLAGGNFNLLAGSGGSELYLTFNPYAEISNAGVPEPSSLMLLGLGTFGVLISRRRRRTMLIPLPSHRS